MATAAIVQAVSDILTTALAGQNPVPVIKIGKPERYQDPVTVCIYHRHSPDRMKTNGWLERQHSIAIGLMLREEAGSTTAEMAVLAYHDAILNAFPGHKSLNGTASTSDLAQQDAPDWVYEDGAHYRVRFYVLTAVENVFLTFSD